MVIYLNYMMMHGLAHFKFTGVSFKKSVNLQTKPSSLDENDKCIDSIMREFNLDLICCLSKATLL
jgi:hypothetical protein